MPTNILINIPDITSVCVYACMCAFLFICFVLKKSNLFSFHGERTAYHTQGNPIPCMTMLSNLDLWQFNTDILPFAVAGLERGGDREGGGQREGWE